MGLTRNGIAYNLKESPYRLEVPYKGYSLLYVFSAERYKKKFYDEFIENREKISESLSKRFGFQVHNDLLSDLRLYVAIEKRGFLVMKDEVKIECLENITLDGEKLTISGSGRP